MHLRSVFLQIQNPVSEYLQVMGDMQMNKESETHIIRCCNDFHQRKKTLYLLYRLHFLDKLVNISLMNGVIAFLVDGKCYCQLNCPRLKKGSVDSANVAVCQTSDLFYFILQNSHQFFCSIVGLLGLSRDSSGEKTFGNLSVFSYSLDFYIGRAYISAGLTM